MSTTTTNLGLFKYDTSKDSNVAFSITKALNNNWDIIDSKCGSSNNLLDFKWSDHLLNDMSWLRADTFSWQSGTTYSLVYNELLSEYNNSASTTKTDGSITYKRTPKGYKIALANQETAILNKYNSDGIAWYYILDTTNKKFKLPRTKFGFEGLRTNVGNDIEAGLPEPKIDIVYRQDSTTSGVYTDIYGSDGYTGTSYSNTTGTDEYMQSSLNNGVNTPLGAVCTNSIYGNSDTVQPPATQMYLYFYVGNFTKSAEAQTAGLKAELLNSKVDSSSLVNCQVVTDTYINGTSGYRIWSDGYCEQWGQGKVISSGFYMRVNFIKPFANTNYIGYGIALSSVEDVNALNYVGIQAKKVNGCTFIGSTHAGAQSNKTMLWKVEGYIA